MLKAEATIFVGKVLAPTMGGWVQLPMENEELKMAMKEWNAGGEAMVSDYKTELPIPVYDYSNLSELNALLHVLKAWEEKGQLKLFLTAYAHQDYDLDSTLSLLIKGNYHYFEEVDDAESLGEAIVCSGVLGSLLMGAEEEETHEMKRLRQKNMVDIKTMYQYLDFEKIGIDYECNGCRINNTLKTAFMPTNPLA